MKEYNVVLTMEQKRQITSGVLTLKLDDDIIVNITRELPSRTKEKKKEYNHAYYLKNPRKDRDRKEYMHEYYLKKRGNKQWVI